jgi:hypothetical protein
MVVLVAAEGAVWKVYPIRLWRRTNVGGNAMRLTILALAATALLLTPVIVSAQSDKPLVTAQATDSTKKKKKTEDNTKTAPSAPPSKGQSTY